MPDKTCTNRQKQNAGKEQNDQVLFFAGLLTVDAGL